MTLGRHQRVDAKDPVGPPGDLAELLAVEVDHPALDPPLRRPFERTWQLELGQSQ